MERKISVTKVKHISRESFWKRYGFLFIATGVGLILCLPFGLVCILVKFSPSSLTRPIAVSPSETQDANLSRVTSSSSAPLSVKGTTQSSQESPQDSRQPGTQNAGEEYRLYKSSHVEIRFRQPPPRTETEETPYERYQRMLEQESEDKRM